MTSRKIQQDIDKCFKQVAIGVEAFDEQYSKYEQSTNPSQREKLVDAIKKECKKLQRLRDQIKAWAAGNEVKDKAPLLEKRELIEKKMEAFKAVEKEMKTKAFSKEGLNASTKMDPKDKERIEVTAFLEEMIEALGQQSERVEAEIDAKQSQSRKAKKDPAVKEQLEELEHQASRHKWHTGKLEVLLRQVENENVEPNQVRDIEDSIRDYVDNNAEVDFMEDDGLYDDFNLDEEGDPLSGTTGLEKTTSQDLPAITDELPEVPTAIEPSKSKVKASSSDPPATTHRRTSTQMKSPLPSLASQSSSSATISTSMKPAPPPSKPAGEPLKYAFAAAAAAASDKSGIGIAPLPAPTISSAPVLPTLQQSLAASSVKSSNANSPAIQSALPAGQQMHHIAASSVSERSSASPALKSPAVSYSSLSMASPAVSTAQLAGGAHKDDAAAGPPSPIAEADSELSGVDGQNHDRNAQMGAQVRARAQQPRTNGALNDVVDDDDDDKAIYHLPASLQELVDSYEAVREASEPVEAPAHQAALAASCANRPDVVDIEKPRHYRPANPSLYTPPHYPQEPLQIFDDPRLYNKIDTDALFYSFYYRQGTHQQFLAAKALKNQSWRFHKQYQTWFQRHEEPKNITEDFEQGTYRFFDYESTWMNRRKADFKFAYKFLEDDL